MTTLVMQDIIDEMLPQMIRKSDYYFSRLMDYLDQVDPTWRLWKINDILENPEFESDLSNIKVDDIMFAVPTMWLSRVFEIEPGELSEGTLRAMRDCLLGWKIGPILIVRPRWVPDALHCAPNIFGPLDKHSSQYGIHTMEEAILMEVTQIIPYERVGVQHMIRHARFLFPERARLQEENEQDEMFQIDRDYEDFPAELPGAVQEFEAAEAAEAARMAKAAEDAKAAKAAEAAEAAEDHVVPQMHGPD